MADSEGFSRLAVASSKVRGERRSLLEKFEVFEKRLVELTEGLGGSGSSTYTTLSTWDDPVSGFSGGITAWLYFDGLNLRINTEPYCDNGQEFECRTHALQDAELSWLARLSMPAFLESLLSCITRNLEAQHEAFSSANEWLAKFVAQEKVAIDEDLAHRLEQTPNFLESWMRARAVVESDPEESITRSNSHLETVLKGCLRRLGDSGYEKMPIEKLTSRIKNIFRDSGAPSASALDTLTGIGTILHSIGTVRNSHSTAHGKNEGYLPPSMDTAQLINHLSGIGSIYIIKQTEKILSETNRPPK
ncbi:abortive infection family protein [Pseudomonas peradeniyensis]|uniref:Abortive infection family protein n=1 Tax=Pseudomonas peradeniyensis TaxID=2745488 RepID=A0ABT2VEF5_9PSED|nr:abortive infection family protein [Pseudomonas peradeniyensis]MCU7239988.1 abortive infection family protein [Pseudomonas peradeniyensis]